MQKTLEKLVGDDGTELYTILMCSIRKTAWDRDFNASKNIFSIALSVAEGRGRSEAFTKVNHSLHRVQMYFDFTVKPF